MAETKDKLNLEIADESIFVSKAIGYPLKKKVYTQNIPYQMVFGNASISLKSNSENIEASMQGMAISNLVINIALSGSLMHLWGMINSLQIIFHMPGNNLALPGNAQTVYATFITIT